MGTTVHSSLSGATLIHSQSWDRHLLAHFVYSFVITVLVPQLCSSFALSHPLHQYPLPSVAGRFWPFDLPLVSCPHTNILMPPQLLPASAAAFAPRATSVNVVLSSKVEPWLTQTLKRINRIKRPLNSVPQHQRCLTETLSSPTAIWTLASLMLPKVPEAEMPSDPNEAMFNHQFIHVEAYI